MKKYIIILLLLSNTFLFSQIDGRIENIKNQLELLSVENVGLGEQLKLESNVTNVSLGNFLLAISRIHKVNINVSTDLNDILIATNFNNITVSELLVFFCKEYQLDIDFTGQILSIKRYVPEVEAPAYREIPITYNSQEDKITMDVNNDSLVKVFRSIIERSGKNLFYSENLKTKRLTFYINDMLFDKALQNLASSNNLTYSKSKEGFYYFDSNSDFLASEVIDQSTENSAIISRPVSRGNINNYFYEVIDTTSRILNVDFKDTPINRIINDIAYDLQLDFYTASALEDAGIVTFKANAITFDHLLNKIFENSKTAPSYSSQEAVQNPNVVNSNFSTETLPPNFGYKKEGTIYFFGSIDLLSVRKVETIQLMYRSLEILGDPSTPILGSNNTLGNNLNGFQDFNNLGSDNFNTNNGQPLNSYGSNGSAPGFENRENLKSLIDIVPFDVKSGLDIQLDKELNTFIVSGSSIQVDRFKKFIQEIDKPVAVVLIEVMFLEINKSATVEAGINWGIADNEVQTQGNLYPNTDMTLGANTVNRIIGGIGGLGSFNLGKVVPEFFLNIKAMEANGDLKILSTPKISTLNGHRAVFSNSETSYYTVTSQNFLGTQNPITSQITNYVPIDAGLTLSIKPYVSGDGQVTLDLYVAQSAFNGIRITNEAPPGIEAREFSSIIRMRDQDIAVLGGLERNTKRGTGSGIPFLARIPIIKWLFSKRKREVSKQKLTVLIKPTIIN